MKHFPKILFGSFIGILFSFICSAQVQNPLNENINTFGKFIREIANIVMEVGGTILVIMLIWAGFIFVTARGDKEKITKAKSMFTWVIIGGFVLLGAYIIAIAVVNLMSDTQSGNQPAQQMAGNNSGSGTGSGTGDPGTGTSAPGTGGTVAGSSYTVTDSPVVMDSSIVPYVPYTPGLVFPGGTNSLPANDPDRDEGFVTAESAVQIVDPEYVLLPVAGNSTVYYKSSAYSPAEVQELIDIYNAAYGENGVFPDQRGGNVYFTDDADYVTLQNRSGMNRTDAFTRRVNIETGPTSDAYIPRTNALYGSTQYSGTEIAVHEIAHVRDFDPQSGTFEVDSGLSQVISQNTEAGYFPSTYAERKYDEYQRTAQRLDRQIATASSANNTEEVARLEALKEKAAKEAQLEYEAEAIRVYQQYQESGTTPAPGSREAALFDALAASGSISE